MLDQVRCKRLDGTLPDAQFADSHFQDLMRDPGAAMRRVYERLGLAWPEGHEARIEAYLRDKPKGKFGAHAYRFEDFDLDPDAIRATYAAYVEHYGIAGEA